MISEEEIAAYKTVLPDCKVVFDVGCRHDNIFYELKPDMEIHLFDPMLSEPLLNKIIGLPNIHYRTVAIGSEKGMIDFYHQYGSPLHRTEEPKFNGMHQKIKVRCDTLKNYCVEKNITHIDLLKIDTEGYDFEVIKGLEDISVKYIIFEDWDNYSGKYCLNDVKEYLKSKYDGCTIGPIGGKPLNYLVKI